MGDNLPVVELPTGFIVAQQHPLGYSTLLLSTDGDIVCFGYNRHGECGVGHTNKIGDGEGEMGDSLVTVDLGEFLPIELGGGQYCACALSSDDGMKWYVVCTLYA